ELKKKIITINRKALLCVLNSHEFYEHRRKFSNQYTTVFARASCYLSLFEDDEVSALLSAKIQQGSGDFQSPAGYFYENGGTDNGYNLNTHHSNMWFAYNYSRNDAISHYFIEEETKFADWIGYNS